MSLKQAEKFAKWAKKNNFGDSMKNSKFGRVKEYIKTRSRVINLAISSGINLGVPIGKSIMLAGPTSSGKTQIALSSIKEAVDKGYTIFYWDSEFAAEESIFKSLDVDSRRVIHMPMAELDDIKTAFTKLCKQEIEEGDKILHIFDSMGAWITGKTLNDAESGKEAKDMTIPGSKKALMTLINQFCGKLNMGSIVINHTYANVGGYGSPTIISGGGALYLPSVILEFTGKAKWKNPENKEEQIGNIFSFIIKKSRLSRESTKGKFAMSNDHGLSKYYGLLDYAIDGGYVTKGKKGRNVAYQLTHQIENEELGEEDCIQVLEKDIYALYETEEIFGTLQKETDFEDYLYRKMSYGVDILGADEIIVDEKIIEAGENYEEEQEKIVS